MESFFLQLKVSGREKVKNPESSSTHTRKIMSKSCKNNLVANYMHLGSHQNRIRYCFRNC